MNKRNFGFRECQQTNLLYAKPRAYRPTKGNRQTTTNGEIVMVHGGEVVD